MKNALILHGTDSKPESNWFPWLAKELEAKGYEVWAPQLPDAHEPSAQKYVEYLFDADWEFNDESIIVGHSSGSVAALHVLQNLPENTVIKHAVLVGAFRDDLQWPSLKKIFDLPLEYEKIKTKEIYFPAFR